MNATKIATGEYEYRGYLIQIAYDMDDNRIGWTICKNDEGGWKAVDLLETKWECKEMVDRWVN